MKPGLRRSTIIGTTLLMAALGGCTDPSNPGQRAVGGGLIGAGAGAAIGALAGGGSGAAIGGLTGGALGAGTGYLTTPERETRGGYGYDRGYDRHEPERRRNYNGY